MSVLGTIRKDIIIIIRDDGIGIPQKNLRNIFEIFNQIQTFDFDFLQIGFLAPTFFEKFLIFSPNEKVPSKEYNYFQDVLISYQTSSYHYY